MLVDLSAAVEAAAKELARQDGYCWDERPAVWRSLAEFHGHYRAAAGKVIRSASGLIMQAIADQVDWAAVARCAGGGSRG